MAPRSKTFRFLHRLDNAVTMLAVHCGYPYRNHLLTGAIWRVERVVWWAVKREMGK